MAVVAVLLIHMDKKAVTPMKPNIKLPVKDNSERKTLRGREVEVWPRGVLQQKDHKTLTFIYLQYIRFLDVIVD